MQSCLTQYPPLYHTCHGFFLPESVRGLVSAYSTVVERQRDPEQPVDPALTCHPFQLIYLLMLMKFSALFSA